MKISLFCFMLGLVALNLEMPGEAQGVKDEGILLAPSGTIDSAPAVPRTMEQMIAHELANPNPPQKGAGERLRSTMDPAAYASLKAQALARSGGSRPLSSAPVSLAPPATVTHHFPGTTSANCAGCRPPDTHGAAGLTQYFQIVNQRVVVYQKFTGVVQMDVSLASFFGYTTQALFDPRVVYDRYWDRWIATAEAFQQSSTVQFHFIAISLTPDATGPYWIYGLDVDIFNDGRFWDYPQLGMDIDAIMITANQFNPGFIGAAMFTVSKALLYNGLGFSVPFFTGLPGTMAPPIVIDQNRASYLLAATPANNQIAKYLLRDSGRGTFQTFLLQAPIPVAAYSVPVDAAQPAAAGGNLLDSLDSRFVNAGTQIGAFQWQTHTVNDFACCPTPRFYRFNINNSTVNQTGNFFASGTSHDWMTSIGADTSNRVWVVWSSTDPPVNINAQVRVSGKLLGDAGIPAGIAIFTSGTFYNPSASTVERWGDYSAVSLDPNFVGNPAAYVTAESIISNTVWGSRIARVTF